jgi:molybdopterin-containing oxidoreductase family membrane subunit
MARTKFQKLENQAGFFDYLIIMHMVVIAAGLAAFWYMEHNGHIVTGMSNKIVWGTPHVFAIFLIVAASGALNIASISSVFNRLTYKPFARLSGLLALSLLAGGLAVLVLDLGRPDRLVVAMTTYNFKSIFAWNIYLYVGFMAVVVVYLFTMMERNMGRFTRPAGYFAFVWRLALTTGTGSIFGFIMAREAFDSAILAPLFIASSFVYGLAFTVLVLVTVCRTNGQIIMSKEMIAKFRGLMMIFIAAVLYFTAVFHLTNLYATQHHGVEGFILAGGNIYTYVFWFGQILIGSIIPLGLLALPSSSHSREVLSLASVLLLIGGLAQIYVILIGGQAYPLNMFPGMEVSSSFQDGEFATYMPSLPEIVLGISGISIAMLISGVVMRIMPFLPKGEAKS